MTLYQVRGYWRRSAPHKRPLTLDELVVAEDGADAERKALAAWRSVFAGLDGEPVCSSVRAVESVGGYAVSVGVMG